MPTALQRAGLRGTSARACATRHVRGLTRSCRRDCWYARHARADARPQFCMFTGARVSSNGPAQCPQYIGYATRKHACITRAIRIAACSPPFEAGRSPNRFRIRQACRRRWRVALLAEAELGGAGAVGHLALPRIPALSCSRGYTQPTLRPCLHPAV